MVQLNLAIIYNSISKVIEFQLILLVSSLSHRIIFLVTSALLCLCSDCNQANATCETDGACMVSITNVNGMKHHTRTCIPEVKLIPAGKPFFCLSSEAVRNTHCCYFDYCNKIDLMVPSGKYSRLNMRMLCEYENCLCIGN